MDVSDQLQLEKRYFSITTSNWTVLSVIGRCTVEYLGDPSDGNSSVSELSQESYEPTHIIIVGSLTITASSQKSRNPAIYIHQPSADPVVLQGPSATRSKNKITAVTIDQSGIGSQQHLCNIVVIYESGMITIFEVNTVQPSASTWRYSQRGPRSDVNSPIIRAVYHHPLLVTLSSSFHLALHHISNQGILHTQTLTSYTSYPPSSLVLSRASPALFKLVLSYAVPVFPAHWSIAATELTITSDAPPPGSAVSGGPPPPPSSPGPSASSADLHISSRNPQHSPCVVSTSRTIRTIDFPPGWVDETQMRKMREQWHRRVDGVADTQTDGKWVVLAPQSDSSGLQLYRLHFPAKKSNASPRLTFVRSLHGHTGPVTSLALADGRCVSLGMDGSLWAWDLEHGWGSEVQSPRHPGDAAGPSTVVFDDRRIISADSTAGVEVRNFDL